MVGLGRHLEVLDPTNYILDVPSVETAAMYGSDPDEYFLCCFEIIMSIV